MIYNYDLKIDWKNDLLIYTNSLNWEGQFFL